MTSGTRAAAEEAEAKGMEAGAEGTERIPRAAAPRESATSPRQATARPRCRAAVRSPSGYETGLGSERVFRRHKQQFDC